MVLIYYNTITGVKTVKPFAKNTDTIPDGHQAEPPTLEIDKVAARKEMQATIAAGATTTVRGIVMQCDNYDITLLSLSHIKTFVRDIDNVMHSVTEAEYDTIVTDVKNVHYAILLNYWTVIDALP